MRLLLDTHIALWAVTDHRRLPAKARQRILADDSEVFVSVISVWEIAIKHALNRGDAGDMPLSGRAFSEHCEANGYDLLPVTQEHALAVGELPLLHRDPFDRMLVAQARTEPLRLLTVDRALLAYGDWIELF